MKVVLARLCFSWLAPKILFVCLCVFSLMVNAKHI
uniref:Uncharacterized protein n=1 Tax=Rhizophora mucronata TaxID=61149 RepID=A0A2P2PT64_RHIMU